MRTQSKIAYACVAFVVALSASVGAYWYLRILPKPQTSYYGIALDGDGKPEVNYKLGTPNDVIGEADTAGPWKGFAPVLTVNPKPGDKNTIPEGRDFTSYDDWDYSPNPTGPDIAVSFRKSTGKVVEIRCTSMDAVPGACHPLAGVNIGDSEDSVRQRLGTPTDASIEGPTKTLVYLNLHVMVLLTKQRVYGIAVGHWVRKA